MAAFDEESDLQGLGFDGARPASTGRTADLPAVLLEIHLHGYLNRIQSSRRLVRECQRNCERMRLNGRLALDLKTISPFRRPNRQGIFALAGRDKPNIGLLSDEFLEDVRPMKRRNLAVELLEKLLRDKIKARARNNVVQKKK